MCYVVFSKFDEKRGNEFFDPFKKSCLSFNQMNRVQIFLGGKFVDR